MATTTGRRGRRQAPSGAANLHVASSTEALMLAALERGEDLLTTGRFLVTYKEGAADAAMKHLQAQAGMRVANARDFKDQAIVFEAAGDADAIMFPEIGVALVSGRGAASRGMTAEAAVAEDSPVQSIDPEYFMFANAINASDYMKGVLHTAQMIAADLGEREAAEEAEISPAVLGATWGLIACKVPPSARDGSGIKVAVLDTGFDLGHPEFAGRAIVSKSFVGQPVQDLHGHGTHTAGTACGPKSPPGAIQRYGIGFKSQMFIGKVLTNSGSGTQAQVLAGMNWAIANKCPVISMSLGAPIPVQPSYTAAGAAALNNGCLMTTPSKSPFSPTAVRSTSLDLE